MMVTPPEPAKDVNETSVDAGKVDNSPEMVPDVSCLLPEAMDLSRTDQVAAFLGRLLPTADAGNRNPIAALVPWICERLRSEHSRKAYARDLTAFFTHLRAQGIEPLAVNADHVRIYAAALLDAPGPGGRPKTPATVARMLSAIRGTYRELGRRGIVDMETVRLIQAVQSPEVYKNMTPALTEAQACRLLHAPDRSTLKGKRDFALLFCFFKTACRASALANALVGHVEREDTAYFLKVWEKRRKPQRKALLEAAPALLDYLRSAGIEQDRDGPLFRPVAKDRQTLLCRPLHRRDLWRLVKWYCRKVDINPDRIDGRGIGVHTLRKTAITNALQHGAPIQKVQQLAGHAQITTTQLYFAASLTDAEDAARHIQIR